MRYILLLAAVITFAQLFGQSVGTKVSIVGVDGKNYTGVITAIQDGKYKVKYDGYDFDAWLNVNQFKVTPSNVPAPAINTSKSNSGYKTGDIVIVKDNVGNWLPADILEVSGGKYKIHFRGYTDYYDTWVGDDRIRTPGSKKETNNVTNNKQQSKDPEMNGSIPKIIGTAWSLLAIYDKGTTPKNTFTHYPYIFGNNGRYEIQIPAMTSMGKYRVSGNQITEVADGSDHLTETFTLKWNATGRYLELVGSSKIIRLEYNSKASF